MSNAARTRLGRRAAIRQTLAGAVAQGIACMALAGPLAVVSGWANAASQSAQAFDIAAGPLASALNQFGQSAHILLSYPAQLVEGKNSPGLHGQHAVDSGLAVLLSGTGLQAVREANGNYSLVVAAVPGRCNWVKCRFPAKHRARPPRAPGCTARTPPAVRPG